MDLENDYRRERGNGSGTEIAYMVEARINSDRPEQIGDQIFDNRWREVHFVHALNGVPRCSPYARRTIENGLLGYPAAQALRWWLHANADKDGISGICLETRIIKYEIAYSYSITAVSSHKHIHGDDRSNLFPDWGEEKHIPADTAPGRGA